MNERVARWWMALAGVGGCLLIAVVKSSSGGGFSPQLDFPERELDAYWGSHPFTLLIPLAATVLALCLLRWWPYLVLVGGLFCTPIVFLADFPGGWMMPLYDAFGAAFPLLVIGVLGAAQSLLGASEPGPGATVAALTIGSALFGQALPDRYPRDEQHSVHVWHIVLLVTGLAVVGSAAWRWRRGDRPAVGLPDTKPWSWKRLRLIAAGGLVALSTVPLGMISTERLSRVLHVSWWSLDAYPNATLAIRGGMVLVTAAALTILAGRWPLAGALTAAIVLIAVSAPVGIALAATNQAGPSRWFAALLGVAIGAVAAAHRWRIAAAVTLTLGAATCAFIAHTASNGQPQKLAEKGLVVPSMVMLVLAIAAATAVVGATAPVLSASGAVPAVLGPITGVLVVAGVQTASVIGLNGEPWPRAVGAALRLDTAGVTLVVAAAGVGGLGVAHNLSVRWAERKKAELIRREAAAAERDRLARPIHDGVLQVLALVQREGSELGGAGPQLAVLAGEQELALRNLLSGNADDLGPAAEADLRARLHGLGSAAIEVSAPGDPVLLPAGRASELTAAVQAALDNVRQHAGPDARAWILLEDEGEGVRVTVRDDGAGFEPGRLEDAARSGRLGVEQSMRGRIRDLGGTMTIKSRPGRGTEVEFWVPRRRTATF